MSQKHDLYQKVRLDPEVIEEAYRRMGRMQFRPTFTNFINTTLKPAFGLPKETDSDWLNPK